MSDDDKAVPEDEALARLGEKLGPKRDAGVDSIVRWMRAMGVRLSIDRPPELQKLVTQLIAAGIDIGIEFAHDKNTIPAGSLADQLEPLTVRPPSDPPTGTSGVLPALPGWDREDTPTRNIPHDRRRGKR